MMLTTDWFEVRQIDAHTYALEEPSHVRSYLIIGDERAILFDTGLGVAPIRPVVEGLTELPVLVVNSHHHFDHVGGNHEFTEIAIHTSGAELLASGPTSAWLTSYWSGFLAYVAQAQPPRSRVRPLPEGFNPVAPDFRPSTATRHLRHAETIDLGGRHLQVAHVPGHTQDSICLIDASHGFLFGGDAVDSGAIYTHLPTGDPRQFIASLTRLERMLPSSITSVLSPHGAEFQHPIDIVRRLAHAIERAIADGAEIEMSQDCFLQAAPSVHVDDFIIYLADIHRNSSPGPRLD